VANILIEAEAYAVWKSPEGRMVDITPHNHGEDRILFLPDKRVIYKNNQNIANIRQELTSSPLVERLIYLYNERVRTMCSTPGDKYSISKLIVMEINQIQYMLHQEVKGNEFCPCRSGLKYKKCCGK